MSEQFLVDAILTRTKRGPYNKISKMQRLQRVKELYFDEEYSIIDIANTLGINRNTVSSDVEYWRKEYAKFGGENEIIDFFYSEISAEKPEMVYLDVNMKYLNCRINTNQNQDNKS